jgi:agmatinase
MSDTHSLWADLHKPNSQPSETTFSVLGIPYDRSASTRQGAAAAPDRIRYFTHHLTPITEDRTILTDLSVCDLGDVQIDDQVRDFETVRATVAALPNIPILLGGDHSVTVPIFQGQRQRFAGKRLGVLWVDAHPDLCDVFDGSALSHACVLRRGIEAGIEQRDICMVGLRSWELPEVAYITESQLNVYAMPQVAERGISAVAAEVRKILSACDAVHISLDIDCLDPAAAPGTGIPDAGGMTMREVLTLLKAMQGLPLVGLDVVEVSPPIDPSEATVFAALKIIMEFMGVIARAKQ